MSNPVYAPKDTEDKRLWLAHGENLEREFVEVCKRRLNMDISINPQKRLDPTVPDLAWGDGLADLKCQNTPFFTASRYRLDPRYTVTFNRKDYERYKTLYPSIEIFFWVDWKRLSAYGVSINYLAGIYRVPFAYLRKLIEGGAPEHEYARRVLDTQGNAKTSFLLDVRGFQCLSSHEG